MWVGKRCGYTPSHFGGAKASRYLAMRLTRPYVDPVAAFPDHSPGGAFHGHIPRPAPGEYDDVHAELRRTTTRAALRVLALVLVAVGVGSALGLLYGYKDNGATALWLLVSMAPLTTGLSILLVLRRTRRRAPGSR